MRRHRFAWKVNEVEFEENFETFSFHELAEEYNFKKGEYDESFVNLIETDENREQILIMEDVDNYHKIFEVAVSDYICEINSVIAIQKYDIWRVNLDNSLEYSSSYIDGIMYQKLLFDTLIFIAINFAKLDISLLQNVPFNTSNFENEKTLVNLLHHISDYIKEYHETDTNEVRQQRSLNIQSMIEDEMNSTYLGGVLRDNMKQIRLWIKRLGELSDIQSIEVENYTKNIRKEIYKIPHVLGGVYKRRYKELKSIVNHNNLEDDDFDIERVVCMAISSEQYKDEQERMINLICDKIKKLQENTIYFEEIINGTYQEKLRELEAFFGKNNTKLKQLWNGKREREFIEKFFIHKAKCFAIMHTNKGDYFALSTHDDYKGGIYSSFLKTTPIVQKLVMQLNQDIFKGRYIWAQLQDNTRRYTEPVNDKDVKLIVGYVELKDDSKDMHGDMNLVGRTYGCCERKMQAACNDYSCDKIFYSKWAPCKKCRPAIMAERGSCRIFAFAKELSEVKEMIKKDNVMNITCPIKEYEISYNVQEKYR